MGFRTRALTALTSVVVLASGFALVGPKAEAAAPPTSSPALIAECAGSWRLVGTDTFRGQNALMRSQGVTSDGDGWIFSWQLGISRTGEDYVPQTVGVMPPKILVQPKINADFTNHLGNVHIGGIDTLDGLLYAPAEDTGYNLSPLPISINNPEYQTPYMALFDAHSMRPKGQIALDPAIHEAGVPWAAADAAKKEIYTAEWDMHDNRLNVFTPQMKFKRFLPLVYPPALGAGFRLTRIQGAKVLGNTLFAARDDNTKTVYGVDLTTGVVSKKFTLNTPGTEIEDLAIKATPDGALIHVLNIVDGDDFVKVGTNGVRAIRVQLQHWAPVAGPGCGTDDLSMANPADVANMLHFEDLMKDHIHSGHIVESTFATDARLPGQVVGTGGWGDSGLWTGVYLGGQAMRYQVAKKKLATPGITPADTAFWTAQRDEASSRAKTILAAEHIDINISEDWEEELILPPQLDLDDPLNDKHFGNFGGGIIKGEKGMIQRSCTEATKGALGINPPTKYPNDPIRNNDNRVFEITWKSGDGKKYYCETSPSRDTYAGLTFGLLTAFDMIGPDFPALRDQIRADLLAMGDFLVKWGWTYPRPHGYLSVEHDFNNFVSPLFVYTPEARMNIVTVMRHVANNGGTTLQKLKWNAIFAQEFAVMGTATGTSLQLDTMEPHESYYKWNLSHLNAFNMLRTLTGAERDVMLLGQAPMDKTTRDDANAHFEAIMYAMTGEQDRLADATKHLREWLQWRANVEAGPVNNEARCGLDFKCVPRDHRELGTNLADGGSIVYRPGNNGPWRADRPLPVAKRTPTDFLWQRSPDQLNGSQPKTHRMPAIDFLTPYWMIRYFTEVAPPALTPMPEWPISNY